MVLTNNNSSNVNSAYGIDAFLIESHPNNVIVVNSCGHLLSLLKDLKKRAMPFVVRGAGTGYAGACIPDAEETVISLAPWNPAIQIDDIARLATVSPSVTAYELDQEARRKGLRYPPDPASYKISTIGGNVATNAGGPHCLLYGVTNNFIQELECWTPLIKGRGILRLGAASSSTLTCNLRDLFIGSEGTLGIFTEIKAKLLQVPPTSYTYLVDFDHYSDAIRIIEQIFQEGIIVAALDMSIDPWIPERHGQKKSGKLYISLEGGGEWIRLTKPALENLLRRSSDHFSAGKSNSLMKKRASIVRKNVSGVLEATDKKQYLLFDAVVPRALLGSILEYCYELADAVGLPFMNTFHAADGNIHPTLFFNPSSPEDLRQVKRFWYSVLRRVVSLNGSITGEHGNGIEKVPFSFFESEETLDAFTVIKNYFDPNGLLNRNKIFASKDVLAPLISDFERERLGNASDAPITFSPHCEVSSGFRTFRADATLKEVDRDLEPYRYCFPYEPVYMRSLTLAQLIKAGIPSSLTHLFELNGLIIGGSVRLDGKIIEIGKKVIKDVSGYSLKFLMYSEHTEINEIRLKIFPRSAEELYRYFLIKNASAAIVERLKRVFSQYLVNLIITEDNGLTCYGVCYNDRSVLKQIRNLLDPLPLTEISIDSLKSVLEEDPTEPTAIVVAFDPNGITRKGLTELKRLGIRYFYSVKDLCAVIPTASRASASKLARALRTGALQKQIEAIRHVDECGSHLLCAKNDILRQKDIVEDLVLRIARNETNGLTQDIDRQHSAFKAKQFHSSPVVDQACKCTRCGLCLFACKAYQHSKLEHESPRGIVNLILNGNELAAAKQIESCDVHCSQKSACMKLCPTAIDFDRIRRMLRGNK